MDEQYLSVTALKHHVLETLEESPFGGQYAVGYDGKHYIPTCACPSVSMISVFSL